MGERSGRHSRRRGELGSRGRRRDNLGARGRRRCEPERRRPPGGCVRRADGAQSSEGDPDQRKPARDCPEPHGRRQVEVAGLRPAHAPAVRQGHQVRHRI